MEKETKAATKKRDREHDEGDQTYLPSEDFVKKIQAKKKKKIAQDIGDSKKKKMQNNNCTMNLLWFQLK